jgi:hypothetical protein
VTTALRPRGCHHDSISTTSHVDGALGDPTHWGEAFV